MDGFILNYDSTHRIWTNNGTIQQSLTCAIQLLQKWIHKITWMFNIYLFFYLSLSSLSISFLLSWMWASLLWEPAAITCIENWLFGTFNWQICTLSLNIYKCNLDHLTYLYFMTRYIWTLSLDIFEFITWHICTLNRYIWIYTFPLYHLDTLHFSFTH